MQNSVFYASKWYALHVYYWINWCLERKGKKETWAEQINVGTEIFFFSEKRYLVGNEGIIKWWPSKLHCNKRNFVIMEKLLNIVFIISIDYIKGKKKKKEKGNRSSNYCLCASWVACSECFEPGRIWTFLWEKN